MSDAEQKEARPEAAAAQAPAAGPAPASLRVVLGEKVGMTQLFHPKYAELCAVSIVRTGPCSILRVKTADGPDGYEAVALAYGVRKEKNLSAPEAGQFKKAGLAPARFVQEIRVPSAKGLAAGQTVSIGAIFKPGDYVDVQGTSKGHGFAGVMKRHNFRGLPGSHGASDKERSPGSLASRRALGRVLPGQRMAGRMGHETSTVHKVEVIKVDEAENLLYINGPVPGPIGGFVRVLETVKARKERREPIKTIRKTKMGTVIGKAPSKPAKK